jgi:hypothetical protein
VEPVLTVQGVDDRLGPGDHARGECIQAGGAVGGVGDAGPLLATSPRALVTEGAGAEESPEISNHGACGRRILWTP